MLIVDEATGLTVGDPEQPLVDAAGSPDDLAVATREAVDRMILSASGWRTVFAADGDEESATATVRPEHLIIAAVAAECFVRSLSPESGKPPHIVVGVDTRPTGPLLARAAMRSMIEADATVEYLFVAASPEIMAYAGTASAADGFFYVSASHNPIGHNGLKMGGHDGGVLAADRASELIAAFRDSIRSRRTVARMAALLRRAAGVIETRVLAEHATAKSRALAAYSAFCEEVIRGPGPRAGAAYDALRDATRAARPGVVADLNGSARAASIDRDFLTATGCTLSLLNDRPGGIAHQIVPEGPGLAPCAAELERLNLAAGAAQNAPPLWVMGYVPDNDGDRGNLVFHDETTGRARQLEAQEVFALAVVAELSWLVSTGEVEFDAAGRPARRVAVVVNGPTSLRIDRIAEAFGAEVHRAEVGEANVVGRARELRSEGVLVRVLGEGSNGGNITHPSSVRDPLHTIHAVLKLLYAPGGPEARSPAQIWLERRGAPHGPDGGATPTLASLLATLPPFTTTSAFTDRAIMRIRSGSHAELKARFEAALDEAWRAVAPELTAQIGAVSYRVLNYERTAVLPGPGNRTGSERGGLKVEFLDASNTPRGFVWMRGSGTEPVFRVMADVEGHRPELESRLLHWVRDLVARADTTPA